MPVKGTTLTSLRPLMQGVNGMVVASHPSAAMAGLEVLKNGGNAIDAGVAVGLALNDHGAAGTSIPPSPTPASSGRWLSLKNGGNAIDAGVAVGLALNVVHVDDCSFLGVAPTVIYLADRKEVTNHCRNEEPKILNSEAPKCLSKGPR